jgi:integrase
MREVKKPKTITQRQADELHKYLPTEQDRIITEFAIETGLRISDILNLKAWDLDKIIYVREQKTNKHRAVEIRDELYKKLLPIKNSALKNNDRLKYAFYGVRNARKHYDRTTYHRHLKRALTGFV